MAEEEKKWHHGKWRHAGYGGGAGPIYGMGLLGSLVYFIQHASGFPDILLGIIKAIFWPAYLLYQLLDRFKF